MNFNYDSPEAVKRQKAVDALKTFVDTQMPILAQMRSCDGRTTSGKELITKSAQLEKNIQACIATIINPK